MARVIHPVYDAAMPKGPLIQNRVTREIVVAIVMALLLAASLGASAFLSGATLGF